MQAVLFPGQGSQRRGMGGALFDEIAEYARVERDVDRVAGCSIRRLCLEDQDGKLNETRYTEPAMYIVNALHYYSACAQGVEARWYAGHCVGEYNALHAAGVFDLLTGLRIVCKRGELMSTVRNGRMATVVGLACKQLPQLLRDAGLYSLDIAAFNSPVHMVLSGPEEDIGRAGAVFERSGGTCYMPLAAGTPFHSRYMAGIEREFAHFLEPFVFRAPRIPVLANVSGEPYPITDASERVRSLLVQQITRPVQWTRSIRFLLQHFVTTFHECGPGTALTRLVQQIRQFPLGPD